jgi:hypothetical protein
MNLDEDKLNMEIVGFLPTAPLQPPGDRPPRDRASHARRQIRRRLGSWAMCASMKALAPPRAGAVDH